MLDREILMQNIRDFDIYGYMNYLWGNMTIESFLKMTVVYFFIVWISIIIWVYKDITNRTESILLQIISILLVTLFTPLGVFVYLLIRPSRSIFEKFYQEVEENLDILSDTIKNNIIECFKCGSSVNINYLYCPHCEQKLQHECEGCSKKIFFDFKICPYCGKKNKKKK